MKSVCDTLNRKKRLKEINQKIQINDATKNRLAKVVTDASLEFKYKVSFVLRFVGQQLIR